MKAGAGCSRSSDVASQEVCGWMQMRCPHCAGKAVGKVSWKGHDSEKECVAEWTPCIQTKSWSNFQRDQVYLHPTSQIKGLDSDWVLKKKLRMQVPGAINRLIAITLCLVSSPRSWYQSAAVLQRRKLDRRLVLPGCWCCCKQAEASSVTRVTQLMKGGYYGTLYYFHGGKNTSND